MSDPSSVGATSVASAHALTSLRAASERAGLDGFGSRLAELQEWLGRDLEAIERQVAGLYRASASGLAERAAAHLLGRRGKRIRPFCVLLGACLGGAEGDPRAIDVAVACELVHTATLLHDDVIDEGAQRRGAQTARLVFGNTASILAGDCLLIDALERVRRTGCGELLAELLEAIAQMVAAEALQLERRGALDASRDAYWRIVDGKTAALFRWALCAGARLGRLANAQHVALAEAGLALGRAFQLIDDALDLDGDPALVGKDLLADLAQGKLTWPVLIAVERDPELLVAIHRAAGSGDFGPAIERIRKDGAVEATRSLAREQGRAARLAIGSLPQGAARDALEAVVHAVVNREA